MGTPDYEPITPPPDQQPPGGDTLGSPERGLTPEQIAYTQNLYTIEGTNRIKEIKEAILTGEYSQFREAVNKGLALCEGLTSGMYGRHYDLNDRARVGELMDKFTTIESSTARPHADYVMAAMREGFNVLIEDGETFNDYLQRGDDGVQEWRDRAEAAARQRWANQNRTNVINGRGQIPKDFIDQEVQTELETQERRLRGLAANLGELTDLRRHAEVRLTVFDYAFRQRQQAVVIAENQQKLTDGGFQPDAGHWEALYWGNRDREQWHEEGVSDWGDAVDRVERVIEDIGAGRHPLVDVPFDPTVDQDGEVLEDDPAQGIFIRDIYANGFRSTGEFRAFLNTLLKESEIDGQQRMDVVWAAWRASLWKERITRQGWKVEFTHDEKTGEISGKYSFGNPPYNSDLLQKTMHGEKMRANEYGWKALQIVDDVKEGKVVGQKVVIMDWDRGKRLIVDKAGFDIRDGRIYVKGWVQGKPEREQENLQYGENFGRVIGEEDITEADFQRQQARHKGQKTLSHSGHPLSIGRIGQLVEDYMNYAKAPGYKPRNEKGEIEKRQVKGVSLQEIWMGIPEIKDSSGKTIRKGYPPVSQGNRDFPWANTDVPRAEEGAEEMSGGTTGLWFLKRYRAFDFRDKMVTKLPQAREMTIEYFTPGVIRAAEKIGKIRPGLLNKNGVPDNPFAWLLAGHLRFRTRTKEDDESKKSPSLRNDRDFRSRDIQNKTVVEKVGAAAPGNVADYDILANALDTGKISSQEADWIIANISKKL